MNNRPSRLTRLEIKNAYKRILLSLLATVIIVLSLVFLGVPAMIKVSVFMGNLKSGDSGTSQEDTTSPYPPRLEASYTATNSATVAVSGYAEPGTSLEVFLNSKSLKKFLVGSDGQFDLPGVTLREGENKITAIAKDTAGNASKPSEPLVITYKNKPPMVEISEPQEGQSFNGDKNIKISGKTEPGSSVYINGRFVVVGDDGSFTFSLPLNQGENTLQIVVTDIAGNQTTVERKVTYNP